MSARVSTDEISARWSGAEVISASQIDTYRSCQRAFAFTYIDGIRTESTQSQKLGTEVDDEQLQPYLRDARPFDYTKPKIRTNGTGTYNQSGEIAATALAYLPKPKTPGLEVQKHFVIPSPTGFVAMQPKGAGNEGEPNRAHAGEVASSDATAARSGIVYQGYLDLWLPNVEGSERTIPNVTDFKTTSDLKWAKTPSTLSADTQAMLYATFALYETRAPSVDLRWIYMRTTGALKAKAVDLSVDGDHVAEQFARIDRIGNEIAALKRQKPKALELRPFAGALLGVRRMSIPCEVQPFAIADFRVLRRERVTVTFRRK